MKVIFDHQTKSFICQCTFHDREFPKRAGFMWNPMTKHWETKKRSKAYFLKDYFDETAEKQFKQNILTLNPQVIPKLKTPNGMKLKPFQIDGALFALERNHSYIAFEQGLGKTPTAIAVANALDVPTLIICPPFLADNWKMELSKWSLKPPPESLEAGRKGPAIGDSEVVIIPDSLIDREAMQDFIMKKDFGLLIVDEAHRFKTLKAIRTKALFQAIAPQIPHVVFLSGTPMPNRPMELFPVLSNLAHNEIDFLNEHDFGVKFCDAFHNGHGYDYRGASNLDELKSKMKNFMFRKTKAEVLPELEPKEIKIVKLTSVHKPAALQKVERTLLGRHENLKKIIANKNLGEVAKYRKELGVQKLKLACQYIDEIMAETNETLLVFAWHTEILEGLQTHFKSGGDTPCALIYGDTEKAARTLIEKRFQKGKYRILFAQIQTMVGLNLTNAERCIFVEFSWSPSDNEQAMDRAHRIGQEKSLVVEFLTLAKTLDDEILNTLNRKTKIIKQVIEE